MPFSSSERCDSEMEMEARSAGGGGRGEGAPRGLTGRLGYPTRRIPGVSWHVLRKGQRTLSTGEGAGKAHAILPVRGLFMEVTHAPGCQSVCQAISS